MRTKCKASLLGVWLLALGLSLGAQEQKPPTAAELSKNETPGKAFTRFFDYQEYQFRSAAEAMPEERRSRIVQERETAIRTRRGAHLRGTGETCGLCKLFVCRLVGWHEST